MWLFQALNELKLGAAVVLCTAILAVLALCILAPEAAGGLATFLVVVLVLYGIYKG